MEGSLEARTTHGFRREFVDGIGFLRGYFVVEPRSPVAAPDLGLEGVRLIRGSADEALLSYLTGRGVGFSDGWFGYTFRVPMAGNDAGSIAERNAEIANALEKRYARRLDEAAD